MKLRIRKKDITLIIFTIFFCYLFVFQEISRTYIDEIIIIILIPLSFFVTSDNKKIQFYMIPVCIMFGIIVLRSTELHSSFLYYFIMVEAVLFVRPDLVGIKRMLYIIQKNALLNAFFVLFEVMVPSIFIFYANTVFLPNVANGYAISLEKGYCSGINNQVSFTAVYISLGIFLEIYFLNNTKIYKNASLIVMVLALIATNKRSHLIYLFVAILGCYYISSRGLKQMDRAFKILLAISVIIIAIYFLALIFPSVAIFSRIVEMFDKNIDLNSISSGRVAIYMQLLELYKKNKVMGIGWQNFADFSKARSVYGGINQGHNVFLQLLCEVGITGFCVFVFIMLFYIVREIKTYRLVLFDRKNKCEEISRYLKYSLASFVFYWLFWFTGNALYDAVFFYMWIISIIIAESLKKYI